MVKKLLATLLASVIGVGGIACIDNEARVMIDENSKQIKAYYSEYKEDFSNLEESITECTHNCKDYTHLEEQYEDLSVKYNELSLWCEENKEKEYKVGDIIEIPVYCYGVKIDTLQCYITILDIDKTSIKGRYTAQASFSGYFNTKSLGPYTSTAYIMGIKAEFTSGRAYNSTDAIYKQTENILADGEPYYMKDFILPSFKLSAIALENNAVSFYIQ